MDPQKARQHTYAPSYFQYNSRDAIIYALGGKWKSRRQSSVGAKTKDDLRYLYENDENFVPLPTFVVAPGLQATGVSDNPGLMTTLSNAPKVSPSI